MTPPFRYRLSDREKDALLTEQAALIERQAARIAELEGLLCRPRKTSRNSGLPPSCDQKPGRSGNNKGKAKPRPSRPGSARSLADAPDETIKRLAATCPHCAADVSGQTQSCRHGRVPGSGVAPVLGEPLASAPFDSAVASERLRGGHRRSPV